MASLGDANAVGTVRWRFQVFAYKSLGEFSFRMPLKCQCDVVEGGGFLIMLVIIEREPADRVDFQPICET